MKLQDMSTSDLFLRHVYGGGSCVKREEIAAEIDRRFPRPVESEEGEQCREYESVVKKGQCSFRLGHDGPCSWDWDLELELKHQARVEQCAREGHKYDEADGCCDVCGADSRVESTGKDARCGAEYFDSNDVRRVCDLDAAHVGTHRGMWPAAPTDDEKAVDRVARALHEAFDRETDTYREIYRREVRKFLAALRGAK